MRRRFTVTVTPIRTPAEHEQAIAKVEELWGAETGTLEGAELDVLMNLMHAYEEAHQPISPPTPIEAILFRLDQAGLPRKALEGIIGSRARVSEILGGTRELTLPMIKRLHEHLAIPLESLIGKLNAEA